MPLDNIPTGPLRTGIRRPYVGGKGKKRPAFPSERAGFEPV